MASVAENLQFLVDRLRMPARVLRRLRQDPGLLPFYLRKAGAALELDISLMDGYAFLPLIAYVSLTNRCGLDCEFCHVEETFDAHKQELSPETWGRIIDNLGPQPPIICLFGGDPLFYKEFRRFMELAVGDRGAPVEIITNGLLLDRHVETLLAFPPLRVTASVHGYGELHDRVVGRPGAFDRAMAGVRALRDAVRTSGQTTPEVWLTLVFTTTNLPHVADSMAAFMEEGFRHFSLGHQQVIGRGSLEEHNRGLPEYLQVRHTIGIAPGQQESLPIDGKEVRRQVERIEALKQAHPDLVVHTCPELRGDVIEQFYDTSTTFPYNDALCKVPWRHLIVMTNGDVSVNGCCFGGTFGNLANDRLEDLWNTERMRQMRRETRERRQFTFCQQCPGIFSHNGYL